MRRPHHDERAPICGQHVSPWTGCFLAVRTGCPGSPVPGWSWTGLGVLCLSSMGLTLLEFLLKLHGNRLPDRSFREGRHRVITALLRFNTRNVVGADNWQKLQQQRNSGRAHPRLNSMGVKRHHRPQRLVHVMVLPSTFEHLNRNPSTGLVVGDGIVANAETAVQTCSKENGSAGEEARVMSGPRSTRWWSCCAPAATHSRPAAPQGPALRAQPPLWPPPAAPPTPRSTPQQHRRRPRRPAPPPARHQLIKSAPTRTHDSEQQDHRGQSHRLVEMQQCDIALDPPQPARPDIRLEPATSATIPSEIMRSLTTSLQQSICQQQNTAV